MRETVYQFGKERSLVGIWSEAPEGTAPPFAVILLNSGLIHRVGPNRLYVRMARRFAEMGYPTLRMDFAGIGDSSRRGETDITIEESIVRQIGEAMDFFEAQHGVKRFVLSGICAGGDAAFLAASSDARICGIIPVDLYSYSSGAFMKHMYQKRLLQPRSWLNLLSGKSDILKLILGRILATPKSASPGAPADMLLARLHQVPAPEKVLSDLKNLFEKNMPVLLVYSDGSPAYFNYQRLFRSELPPFEENGLLAVRHLAAADHGFSLNYYQEKLIAVFGDWLGKLATRTHQPSEQR
ncbi:MAG TPA: PhoPQ-activated protein PqaA family protein [Calditrichia bacterium]|nr:hypothetical protein [Calditrichota bacterium]HQU70945.1 PhoPQ-activated protein PqaA family protein [Calditrichia bacterium]HQV32784.1 PhoPQ-activated protein PqaA family protein [Calditrichia bacterium]